ncbi:uncharacterized protein BJ171DRAFT_502620 [Polychytrium aggregatum]|uniref:uncharacterized protein n=1 Tax=Polychytrium aggregatum TaxID=110093 RepID=UPI0022FF2674|nr:uncharacterized protein BJ171DRAFT_502620 [Polychytrium aggregatum]KAI9204994.1 hypothetical protein BJ171DRAFT_502620 [Polychytrium aggregatum]
MDIPADALFVFGQDTASRSFTFAASAPQHPPRRKLVFQDTLPQQSLASGPGDLGLLAEHTDLAFGPSNSPFSSLLEGPIVPSGSLFAFRQGPAVPPPEPQATRSPLPTRPGSLWDSPSSDSVAQRASAFLESSGACGSPIRYDTHDPVRIIQSHQAFSGLFESFNSDLTQLFSESVDVPILFVGGFLDWLRLVSNIELPLALLNHPDPVRRDSVVLTILLAEWLVLVFVPARPSECASILQRASVACQRELARINASDSFGALAQNIRSWLTTKLRVAPGQSMIAALAT